MHTIGLLVFPDFQPMALAATSVFEHANLMSETPAYSLEVISEHGGTVSTSLRLGIETLSCNGRRFDTLIVTCDHIVSSPPPAMLDYLRASLQTSQRIASICTGAFALAEAGLLDGRRATTHWYFARQLRRAYPQIMVDEDKIYVADGPVWTSAGMSAGIDLALALVENDLGADMARAVAKKLVLYHRRAGGQSQYSALLDLDAKSDRVQNVLTFARQHLHTRLSVEQLAEVAHLSPRQFSRLFMEETGQSPAKAVENLRLEAARLMMESGRYPIDVIARDTGFGDRERMRRAFLRAFGQSPQAMQRMTRTLHAN